MAEGDLTVRVPATARHELGDLARAFNDMIRRLAETQVQLTQADKLASVGRLAAGVAHEINNPLTGVLTYASFLLKRADKKELKEDLDVIVRETKRCREIVRGLLDFARQTPPKRQPTDLNETVRRAAAMLMNQLSLNRVALDLDLDQGLGPALADPTQIQQVVVNLLVNAADAVAEGGRIRLATRRDSREAAGGQSGAEIIVEDDGRGISAADLPHVFEPFFSTKGPRGTGLGLAVTWGIVERHGGTIDVESSEGRGSRFTVRLPLDVGDGAAPGRAQEWDREAMGVSGDWDVLIADDEEVVRKAVERVLGAEGLRVAAAADARSALTHPAAAGCRLVLCDLMLPDQSGLDVLRALRAARPGLPIVLMTGYVTADNAAAALAAGAAGFLPKPFDETELLAAVQSALRGRPQEGVNP